jgi:hypothetical protein
MRWIGKRYAHPIPPIEAFEPGGRPANMLIRGTRRNAPRRRTAIVANRDGFGAWNRLKGWALLAAPLYSAECDGELARFGSVPGRFGALGLGALGLGALVLWCFGALVLWCFGALVLWCFGALAGV